MWYYFQIAGNDTTHLHSFCYVFINVFINRYTLNIIRWSNSLLTMHLNTILIFMGTLDNHTIMYRSLLHVPTELINCSTQYFLHLVAGDSLTLCGGILINQLIIINYNCSFGIF